ncbi:MAG: hypothetical protein ACKPA9_07225, partial [Microcystis sp.]
MLSINLDRETENYLADIISEENISSEELLKKLIYEHWQSLKSMIALQIIALTPPIPIEFAREKFGVRAKHSDRKSRVSVIGYCPNASPL